MSRKRPLLQVLSLMTAALLGCDGRGAAPDAQSDSSERGLDADAPSTEIKPFEVHIEQSVLSDLKTRLGRTRFPDQLPNTTWENGTDLTTVRALADYWQHEYDWRAHEARLNRFDQFTTWIDDQRIWFIHERSERPDATPLLLLHGWPSSASELAALIEPLTAEILRGAASLSSGDYAMTMSAFACDCRFQVVRLEIVDGNRGSRRQLPQQRVQRETSSLVQVSAAGEKYSFGVRDRRARTYPIRQGEHEKRPLPA
jgi:hypothetical protein